MFTAYCAVSALPSARNRDRQVRVQDHQDRRVHVQDPQDAMDHVHARVRVRDIRGHQDIPDKTEGKDRMDNKVDSMDKDRTGIRGRALEYQGLFGIEGLF
ncbi:hypothetical protein OHJ21_27200 [Virgibacillus sp. LDC1]|uniref:hypothetical protein n=1 Tax=unclassified Paenibacillus TaxID=185978 RepID=UPI0013FD206C|nr:hypothetical protein [Paenibacillus sp. GM2FR]MCV4234867.1 hypothetical protein [Virgibacillus sp. LDC1]